jgi:hypothetical protein
LSETSTISIAPTWELAVRFYWAYCWRLVSLLILIGFTIAIGLGIGGLVFDVFDQIEVLLDSPETTGTQLLDAFCSIGLCVALYRVLLRKHFGKYNLTFQNSMELEKEQNVPWSLALHFWWANTWRFVLMVWAVIIVSILVIYGFRKYSNLPLSVKYVEVGWLIFACTTIFFVRLWIVKYLLNKSFGPYQLVVTRKEKTTTESV